MFEVADSNAAMAAVTLVQLFAFEVAAKLRFHFLAGQVLFHEVAVRFAPGCGRRRGWRFLVVFAVDSRDAPAKIPELFLKIVQRELLRLSFADDSIADENQDWHIVWSTNKNAFRPVSCK